MPEISFASFSDQKLYLNGVIC